MGTASHLKMVVKEGRPLSYLESWGELFAFVLSTSPCPGGSFPPGESGSHPAIPLFRTCRIPWLAYPPQTCLFSGKADKLSSLCLTPTALERSIKEKALC